MSTITREWLQHQISAIEADGITDSNTLQAFKLALESLEAEAVVITDDMAYAFHHALSDSSLGADEVEEIKTGLRAAFANVTAPPTPVSVPDVCDGKEQDAFESWASGKQMDLTTHPLHWLFLDEKTSAARQAWKAAIKYCRAAMLRGADGSSPVTPDRSDDTTRLDWLDAQNKRLNEYYGTSYGWKFDANFQRNAMMLNDSNYPVMTVRQAIDEAIATAPKQEVK